MEINNIVQSIVREWKNINPAQDEKIENIELMISLLELKLETDKPIDVDDIGKLERYIIQSEKDTLQVIADLCHQYISEVEKQEKKYRYGNTEILEFDGDVLIIDPARFMSVEQNKIGFRSLKELGLYGLEHRTISGNWECHVYDINTQGAIGRFDSVNERVCVVHLDEVRKIAPHFNPDLSVCSVIKNFKGKIQIKVYCEKNEYDCYIDGNGIHKETEKPFVFTTCQTGFKP